MIKHKSSAKQKKNKLPNIFAKKYKKVVVLAKIEDFCNSMTKGIFTIKLTQNKFEEFAHLRRCFALDYIIIYYINSYSNSILGRTPRLLSGISSFNVLK